MLVALSSIHGSPGVTSWALLLAAAWPLEIDRERIVLEADPDGGVLGARYGMGVDPGVAQLVASVRSGDSPNVAGAGRQIVESVWLVPGPEAADTADQFWSNHAEQIASVLQADGRVWFADLGRLRPGSAVSSLADAAALNVLVSRCDVASLVQLPSRVAAIRRPGVALAVLLVGRPNHAEGELRAFLGCDRVWVVPDPEDLPGLTARLIAGGVTRRHLAWRSAISISGEISDLVPVPAGASHANPIGALT